MDLLTDDSGPGFENTLFIPRGRGSQSPSPEAGEARVPAHPCPWEGFHLKQTLIYRSPLPLHHTAPPPLQRCRGIDGERGFRGGAPIARTRGKGAGTMHERVSDPRPRLPPPGRGCEWSEAI